MLMDLSCSKFLEELASKSPAPGGGSVSALAGSLGGALVSMVVNLTRGRKDFPGNEEELEVILETATKLTQSLEDWVDQDTEAFNRVMAAFKMPKASESDKKARSQAIQAAMQNAASVPMQVAKACLQVLELAGDMVDRGNPNALSDAGVAALMAGAGMQGALYNVEINLGSIKDEAFVSDMRQQSEQLQDSGAKLQREIQEALWSKLRS